MRDTTNRDAIVKDLTNIRYDVIRTEMELRKGETIPAYERLMQIDAALLHLLGWVVNT